MNDIIQEVRDECHINRRNKQWVVKQKMKEWEQNRKIYHPALWHISGCLPYEVDWDLSHQLSERKRQSRSEGEEISCFTKSNDKKMPVPTRMINLSDKKFIFIQIS